MDRDANDLADKILLLCQRESDESVGKSIVALLMALAGLLSTIKEDKRDEALARVNDHLRDFLRFGWKLDA